VRHIEMPKAAPEKSNSISKTGDDIEMKWWLSKTRDDIEMEWCLTYKTLR